MRWMRFLPFAALFASLAAVTAPVSAAETAKPALDLGPEGVWINTCDIDRMTDTRMCRMMTYRLFEDGKESGFVALSVIPAGTDYHLFVTTSQGMIEDCAIRVDRQPRIETHIATLNMCMFPNFVSGRTVEQFRNGTSVLVRINLARGGKRDVDFALNGFGRSFEEMQRNLH